MTPSGVEHPLDDDDDDIAGDDVNPTMTPSGVEHLARLGEEIEYAG